jgi:hypothetical protein
LLHMSVVKEIRPREFCIVPISMQASQEMTKPTNFHSLFLLSVTLFVLLKDELSCLCPMWYIPVFNITSPNIREQFSKLFALNNIN